MVATAVALICSEARAQGRAHAGGESQTKPFDEDRIAWQHADGLKFQGLRLAERFRESLLNADDAGRTKASLVGAALQRFRTEYRIPLSRRPTLERFAVTRDAFVMQLRGGQTLDPDISFADFSGRWYGKWDQMQVDHHWHAVVRRTALDAAGRPDDPGTSLPLLVGLQYAWIGDGFGWNYLVRPAAAPGSVILGYVYHLTPHKPSDIRLEFPLVGYFDGPARLIWITPSLIFFEEVVAGTSRQEQRYAITGFNYVIENETVVNVGEGFQAVYTRHRELRPDWLKFPLKLIVSNAP
ncbi:MAG: hypothetical protein HY288_05325 [Planctomycetia bacterium]|nr:hypothetical protein [Planctomycetia bacterium]